MQARRKNNKPHISHHTAYTSCEWCAVCGARYTVCAARCTVHGAARELGLDRECGNADIGRTRMVEDGVQPFKNMKHVLYTKSAYRFWARPCVTSGMPFACVGLRMCRSSCVNVRMCAVVSSFAIERGMESACFVLAELFFM